MCKDKKEYMCGVTSNTLLKAEGLIQTKSHSSRPSETHQKGIHYFTDVQCLNSVQQLKIGAAELEPKPSLNKRWLCSSSSIVIVIVDVVKKSRGCRLSTSDEQQCRVMANTKHYFLPKLWQQTLLIFNEKRKQLLVVLLGISLDYYLLFFSRRVWFAWRKKKPRKASRNDQGMRQHPKLIVMWFTDGLWETWLELYKALIYICAGRCSGDCQLGGMNENK